MKATPGLIQITSLPHTIKTAAIKSHQHQHHHHSQNPLRIDISGTNLGDFIATTTTTTTPEITTHDKFIRSYSPISETSDSTSTTTTTLHTENINTTITNSSPILKNTTETHITTQQHPHTSSTPNHIRCGGIIFNHDKTKLLVIMNKYLHDFNGCEKWGLPKGHIEINESIQSCAMREIYEETNLNVIIDDTTPHIRDKEEIYYILYANETVPVFAHDTNEIAKVLWKPINELYFVNCNRGLKHLLTKINRIKKMLI